jgi:hypothetical protein
MLALQAFGQGIRLEIGFGQIVVFDPLAGQDRPTIVDKRQQQPRFLPFVLGLDVIYNAAEFNVCVKT